MMMIKAEIGVMHLQTNKHQGLPATAKARREAGNRPSLSQSAWAAATKHQTLDALNHRNPSRSSGGCEFQELSLSSSLYKATSPIGLQSYSNDLIFVFRLILFFFSLKHH